MLRRITSSWRIRSITPLGITACPVRRSAICGRRGYADEASESIPPSATLLPNGIAGQRQRDLPDFCQRLISTSSPSTTSLSDLLPHLALRRGVVNVNRSKDFPGAILLLLFTPSYARHAIESDVGLRAFRWLSGDGMLESPLNVVTAVVDALPAPELHGTEGLAYLYRQVPQDEYELWTQGLKEVEKKGHNNKGARSAASLGELSFDFDGLTTANVRPDLLSGFVGNERSYMISLPLAQTLFSTGRTTTMQLTCFAPTSEDNHRLQLVHREELHSAGLRLPFKFPEYNESVALEVSAHFPLTPLTPPRPISDCLGNVIKTISAFPRYGPNRSNQTKHLNEPTDQTASRELEEAISAHFTKQNVPPEAVEVYALIIPSKGGDFALRDTVRERYKCARSLIQFSRETTTGFGPVTIDQGIRDLIIQGKARLCKVLSGGGGWGEKKGLLSLDPDSYASPGPTRGRKVTKSDKDHGGLDWPKDENTMGMEGLKPVVKIGESVMFFLASSKSRYLPARSANSRTGAIVSQLRFAEPWNAMYSPNEMRTDHHTVLGTVPSVMDAVPASAPLSSVTPSSAMSLKTVQNHNVQHIPQSFGALSASPLSFSSTTKAELTNYKERRRHNDYVSSHTKLGVPGSRVAIQRTGTGVMEKFFKPKASPVGVVESDWYAGIWHETTKTMDLGKQREECEESFESQRDARTSEEMEKDVEWIEIQKRQIEDVTRVEDMFERMEHATEVEENATKEPEQSHVQRDSAINNSAASAAQQALSALKKRSTLSSQQAPGAKVGKDK